MKRHELKENYNLRADQFTETEAALRKKLTIISILRLAVFISGILLAVYSFSSGKLNGYIVIFISVILFLYLLKLFVSYSAKADFSGRMAKINADESKAISGDFSPFGGGSDESDPEHDFSYDLDLFGNESLFRTLNRTVSDYGKKRLAGWLKDPYSLEPEMKNRQEAIKDLTSRLDWRQQFIANGSGGSLQESDIEEFRTWLGEKAFIFENRPRRTAIFLLPVITLSLLVLTIAGIAGYQLFLLSFVTNLVVVSLGLKRTNKVHSKVSGKQLYISTLEKMLFSILEEDFVADIPVNMKKELSSTDMNAALMMKKLARITALFDSRLNMIAGFILNGLILWDYHCILSLEKWKKKAALHLPLWLDYIGEMEGYVSLATFAYNNQSFVYPVKSQDGTVLEASELGHPLIDEEHRVCNDIKIDENRIILVTGANMSGKSTFLRTIAVNMVLAMTGAPVCAQRMEFRFSKLFTSMRTTDSLSHGESYFYAELKRLKRLKEMLVRKEKVFFLLDEILKGTNSADKSNGSRLFINRLARLGSTGIVATHDISLGELESSLSPVIINKCFEIDIEGDKISFDYRLRNGITSRMNAALLMREMGLLD